MNLENAHSHSADVEGNLDGCWSAGLDACRSDGLVGNLGAALGACLGLAHHSADVDGDFDFVC